MRKNPSYTALLRPTSLLISEKSATYTIIWQVRVLRLDYMFSCYFASIVAPMESNHEQKEASLNLLPCSKSARMTFATMVVQVNYSKNQNIKEKFI